MPVYKNTGTIQMNYKGKLIPPNGTFETSEYLYSESVALQNHAPLIETVLATGTETLAEHATKTIAFTTSTSAEAQIKVIAGKVLIYPNSTDATPFRLTDGDVLNLKFSTSKINRFIIKSLEADTECFWNILRA